jgi:glutathione peroxidase
MAEKLVFFEMANVNGANARQVYSFLKRALPNDDGSFDVRWNFQKFLIDHEGNPYKRFGTSEAPFTMKDSIELLLKKKEEK